MIDFSATLAPENGLVSSRAIRPPRPPAEPLWQGLAELHRDRTGVPEEPAAVLSPLVVGAYGISPSDTVTRAAGEAVERFALCPVPGEGTLSRLDGLGAGALDPTTAHARLAAPYTARRALRWYAAERLCDGVPLHVPAGLVDYPASPEDAEGFDPSPSGAASGGSRESALLSALLEVVERDAFLTAWAHQLPLHRIDPDRFLAEAPRTPGMRRFRQALAAARATGLSPVLARVPTDVPGVTCTVGIVIDGAGDQQLAAVGASASGDPGVSAVKALQEALQIRSALRLVQERSPATAPSPYPRNDLERAQYFASAQGVRSVERWAAAFLPAGPAEPPATAVALTARGIIDALHRQGASPVAVDLTHRLPDRIRDMGWQAVKVIPVGLQSLRMDETLEFTRHHERLGAVRARLGLDADAGPEPHPLI
ncbi:YcaO-like family protein [Streptomyces sp. NPDC006711]|uniref:YcaO-like family protein n=1 Tax=Streptomyces sp. NPDC006711 TaxID=3364762 RepID=UPI0036A32DB2